MDENPNGQDDRLSQVELELLELRLAQIDEHIEALLATALEAKSLELEALETAKESEPVKAIGPAQEDEGVTCKSNAPQILTNTPYKKYTDKTIYSNAPSK